MEYLSFQEANCQNCYKCIRTCTVKAIELVNNQARIVPHLCVGCGECLGVCPQNAKKVESDISLVKKMILMGEPITVSLAPSFPAFGDLSNPKLFITALRKLGFDRIEETSIGAMAVSEFYKNDFLDKRQHIITTSCPTVNLLVQKYYPEFVNYLSKSISPMMAHNALIKKENADAKVVFIGPCISKKEETVIYKDELQRVDAVLTFDDVRKWIDEENIHIESLKPTEFDRESTLLTKWYPLSGGIEKTIEVKESSRRVIKLDGMEDVIEFLDNLGELTSKTFVEVNACKNGCINGFGNTHSPLSKSKRSECVMDYINESSISDLEYKINELDVGFEYEEKGIEEDVFSDKEIREVLEKTGKYLDADELNCGTCGYDTCKEKAKAVLKGMAELEMCLPYMRNVSENLSRVIIEKTPNGIIVVNRKFEVIEFNPRMSALLKISKKDALNQFVKDLFGENMFELLIAGNTNTYVSKIELPKFNKVMVQSLKYIEHQEVYLGIFQDITDSENRKEELKTKSKEALDMAQDVINKQMVVAHEIAHLLGETTAETKVTLSSLKKLFEANLTDE